MCIIVVVNHGKRYTAKDTVEVLTKNNMLITIGRLRLRDV